MSCFERHRTPFTRWALVSLGIAIAGGLLLVRQHYRLAMVVGESMLPTLHPGELLLVDRRAYVHSTPQRGDVILARYRSDFIVKRVVGLPGEELELRHGILYVDGVALDEHHATKPGALDIAKGKLGDDDFATLGDNRAIPAAIAVHPILSRAEILGKVVGSCSSHMNRVKSETGGRGEARALVVPSQVLWPQATGPGEAFRGNASRSAGAGVGRLAQK